MVAILVEDNGRVNQVGCAMVTKTLARVFGSLARVLGTLARVFGSLARVLKTLARVLVSLSVTLLVVLLRGGFESLNRQSPVPHGPGTNV